MKKMLYFLITLLVVLNIAYYVYDYQKSNATSNEIEYNDQIDLETLQKKLENYEDVTVFFYQPNCIPCQLATPIIEDVSKELDIEVVKLDVSDLPEGWELFDISGTPTIKHFIKGEEVGAIVGKKSKEEYITFINDTVLLN